ncbi:DUF2004 domain-containing protein [Limibacter armeniacum]|uniref:DUF2004 domain-containing protein n=1 Tax=Limibacter armeniacum TaxID=466084 RepID=UPI002FE581EF
MATYTIPFIGDVNLDELQDRYDASTEINGTKVRLDINFDSLSVDTDSVQTIVAFINNLEIYHNQNIQYYQKDYYEDGEAEAYIEEYYEDYLVDELEMYVDITLPVLSQKQQLLDLLELVRVGIYPDGKNYGVFDYSIKLDGEYCNQLLVVITDAKGELVEVTWES